MTSIPSLPFLLDRSFVWALTPEDEWDDLLELGPGICLLFLAPSFGSPFEMSDAISSDADVADTAKEWARQQRHDRGAGWRVQVRFAPFPDAQDRVEVLALLRRHLAGNRPLVPLSTHAGAPVER